MLRLCSTVSFALLIIAGLSVKLAAQGNTSPGQTTSCRSTWTAPVPLRMPDGRPVYIEPGSVGQNGNKVITLGGPSFVWLSPTVFVPDPRDTVAAKATVVNSIWNFTRAGFLFDSTGHVTPIDPPPLGMKQAKPRLFRLDGNELGVVWGQDLDDSHRRERIFYARIKDGKWIDPLLIVDSVADWQRNGGLSGITNTNPFYAVKEDSKSGPKRFAVGFLDNGVWKKFKVPIEGLAPSVNVIPLKDAVVALIERGDHPDAGVWAMRLLRSHSDTLAVETTARLDSGSGSATREALLFKLGADSVLAVWTYRADGSYSLRSALSSDGGKKWHVLASIPASGRINFLGGTRTNSGDIHLVYNTNTSAALGPSGAINHVSFSNGKWSAPDAVTDHEVHGPVIGPAANGVVVTWAEYENQWGFVVAPRSYASWLKSCR